MSSLTFGSLFSGIGGFDLGFERAGMECKWQVEIDEACNKVLQKHWPNIARYKDVREVGKHNLESVDVICGGFPCQDVSLNGLRLGLEGKRSTLWTEFLRIVCEIRPKWIVIENVRGLLSSDDGEFFRTIMYGLSINGYDAEWSIIPTGYFNNLPHKRERIFIVAYPASLGWETTKIFNRESFKNKELSGKHSSSNDKEMGGVSNSDFCRTIDGISSWMDRLKQCGNAVVPQMAEWIGKRIVEVSND
jgi:DNA (cytosine-5)-methyltransferase 1